MVDSEVTLFLESETENLYNLYRIHRKTIHTRMEIEVIGKIFENAGKINLTLEMPASQAAVATRKNFNGTLMRAAAAVSEISLKYE